MSFVNFGMSFVLKGLHHPKIAKQLAKKSLLDGVFQIHLDNGLFVWLVKTTVIHTVSFSELYLDISTFPPLFQSLLQDTMQEEILKTSSSSKCYLIVISRIFNSIHHCNTQFATFLRCELHAQSEAEKEVVHRMLQCIVQKAQVAMEEKLADKAVHKQATVKKKGKVMASKRVVVLNTWRHCLLVFYNENYDQAYPSYHILLHHKVSIHPRKKKSLQIVGTYKNLWIAFKTPDERDSWLSALKSTQIPPPVQQIIQTEAPMFESFVSYAPEARKRKYTPAAIPGPARAGPSAD